MNITSLEIKNYILSTDTEYKNILQNMQWCNISELKVYIIDVIMLCNRMPKFAHTAKAALLHNTVLLIIANYNIFTEYPIKDQFQICAELLSNWLDVFFGIKPAVYYYKRAMLNYTLNNYFQDNMFLKIILKQLKNSWKYADNTFISKRAKEFYKYYMLKALNLRPRLYSSNYFKKY